MGEICSMTFAPNLIHLRKILSSSVPVSPMKSGASGPSNIGSFGGSDFLPPRVDEIFVKNFKFNDFPMKSCSGLLGAMTLTFYYNINSSLCQIFACGFPAFQLLAYTDFPAHPARARRSLSSLWSFPAHGDYVDDGARQLSNT